MAMIRNHRRSKRYEVDGVRGSLRQAQVLEIKNLSLTGLAVESGIPLPIGQVLPIKMLGGMETLDLPAEVIWSKSENVRASDGSTKTIHRAGLKFFDPPHERVRDIRHFLEGHVSIHIDRQMSGQFRHTATSTQPEGQPEARHPFLVKKISFSGMLIETFHRDSIPTNSLLELHLDDDGLRLEGAARVTAAQRDEDHYDIRLDFQDLSSESGQALSSFIRQNLG